MIDFEKEELLSLSDLPKALPLRGGRKIHLSTIYRWVSRGLRGTRLEVVVIGGMRYTSREAVRRFCDQLTQKAMPSRPSRSMAADELRRVERAELAADEKGL